MNDDDRSRLWIPLTTRDFCLRGSSRFPFLLEHDDKNLYDGCVVASLYFVKHCTSRNTVLYICTVVSRILASIYFRESAQHLAQYSAYSTFFFFLFFLFVL